MKLSVVDYTNGISYAIPKQDLEHALELLERGALVRKLDHGEYQFEGPAIIQDVTEVPEEAVAGWPYKRKVFTRKLVRRVTSGAFIVGLIALPTVATSAGLVQAEVVAGVVQGAIAMIAFFFRDLFR